MEDEVPKRPPLYVLYVHEATDRGGLLPLCELPKPLPKALEDRVMRNPDFLEK